MSGSAPEPSDVVPRGYRLRAELHEIEPLPLDRIRDCLPTNRLRFGCFELPAADATRLGLLITDQPKVAAGDPLD